MEEEQQPKAGELRRDDGGKARQLPLTKINVECPKCSHTFKIEIHEDRAWQFSDALRFYDVPMMDIDNVITRGVVTDGHDNPRVLVEVTRADKQPGHAPQHYLDSIDERRRRGRDGNHDDHMAQLLADKLGVPAIVVLFPTDVVRRDSCVWWRFVNRDKWHEEFCEDFFNRLKKPYERPE